MSRDLLVKSASNAPRVKILPFRSYPLVLEDQTLEITAFLEATKDLADLVGMMGYIFHSVKSDILKSIKTLENISKEQKFSTVEDLMNWIRKTKPKTGGLLSFKSHSKALNALLSIYRAISYVCKFMELYIEQYEDGDQTQDLRPIFIRAYDETLRPHHNFLVDGFVHLCLRSAPDRKQFHDTLIKKRPAISTIEEDELTREMQHYLQSAKVPQTRLENFLQEVSVTPRKK